MAAWKHEVNIKQYLTEGDDVEAIQGAYDGIRKALASKRLMWPEEFDRYAELALKEEDVEIFNLGMNRLYDWADEQRIFLGVS